MACNTLNMFTTLRCWAGNGLDRSGWAAAKGCFKDTWRQQLLEGLSMLSMLVVAVAGEARRTRGKHEKPCSMPSCWRLSSALLIQH